MSAHNRWRKDAWPGTPRNWDDGRWQYVEVDGERVRHRWADLDYHVDLGCGRIKKGRVGVDHHPDQGVNVVMDLNLVGTQGAVRSVAVAPGLDAGRDVVPPGDLPFGGARLPFEDSSIESIVTHHCLEHIGTGFTALVNDIYRVLEPDGVLYVITPLFPSRVAVEDPTHCRYFMEQTWASFCGEPGDAPNKCWQSSFSTPYTDARFKMIEQYSSAMPDTIEELWGPTRGQGAGSGNTREIRVVLSANKTVPAST